MNLHSDSERHDSAGRPADGKKSLTAREIQGWLVAQIGELAGLDPARVDTAEPFTSYGIVSRDAVALSGELEELLGLKLSPTLLYEYPNIDALTKHLSGEAEPAAPQLAPLTNPGADREPIAIIGLGCRLPGAASPSDFWRLLCEGTDAVTKVPAERWKIQEFYDADPLAAGKMNTEWGGFLEKAEQFDANFFGISPYEAERMDPQHRLLLEVAWEALEDGGQVAQSLRGTQTGVFVGISTSDYSGLQMGDPALVDAYAGTGGARSMAANRLSYFFDFRGPSLAVDTACSSSLVAIHLACQSLNNGECTLALAGGVNFILAPEINIAFSKSLLLAPDGRCKSFDERADGYIRAEGAGVLVLKPLARALADGDSIYAVIRGSAVNQDGRTNGITAPSPQAQEAVIREAQRRAGVTPEQVQYVEAHGSGTILGDRIEAQALGAVFGGGRAAGQPRLIGTVKSNIGHLEAAAGVAGVMKVTLALKQRAIPPSLHFRTPNPHINFDEFNLRVQSELGPWPAGAAAAGVSSFGFGGTNAHLVLAEAPHVEAAEESTRPQLLLLSAKTNSALETATANLAAHLKGHAGLCLADVAYTLQVGRSAFAHRRAIVCESVEDALKRIEALDSGRVSTQERKEEMQSVAFMFPGLGEQYPGMAAQLYRSEPDFRLAADRCCELLLPHLGIDLRQVLFAARHADDSPSPGFDLRRMLRRGAAAADAGELSRTLVSQPAVFVVEYALAQLLMGWGVRPSAMIGYSIGEYVAACLSGVMSLDDALRVVAARARLIEGLERGAMLAVPLGEEEVGGLLGEGLSLAAVNGPAQCVVSGPATEVASLERRLEAQGVVTVRLTTEHAFHSRMMQGAAEQLNELMRGVELKAPQVPYVSNVTGRWVSGEEVTDPDYWSRHLCGAVRFADGVSELLADPNRVFVEVGPGQTLVAILKQLTGYDTEASPALIPLLPASYRKQSASVSLIDAVGKLWLAGVEMDWAAFYAREQRRRLPMPTYPFERQSYWLGGSRPAPAASNARQAQAGKRAEIADWFYQPVWKETVLPARPMKGGAAQEDSCWLVFVDGCGIGAEIVERLGESTQRSRPVVSVEAGERFERLDEDRYVIDPADPDHYRRLVEGLVQAGRTPTTVIHLWSVTQTGGRSFDDLQDLGFYSLTFLARALGQSGVVSPLSLKVVSSEMQAVSGEEDCSPEKSTVLGACKVIPQEYPQITCRSLDIARPELNGPKRVRLVERLFVELAADSHDLVVAYRGTRRWIQSFEPVRLEAADGPKRLREEGVYLVTGGLGGIGLVLAETLARQTRAKLTLVGRKGLPARAEWESWLASHGSDDPTARKIRKVLELEALGAEVLVANADVADERQMREVIDRTLERFGDLNGVIHGAGVVSADAFPLIQGITKSVCERHFDAKARGLYVLDKLLSERALDFYFLLSSVSSILGGLGFAPYAAANVFMDGFAQKRNQTSTTPWISVNWDAWGVGEEAALEVGGRRLEQSAADFQMTPAEGAEAFLRALSQDAATHLVNSTGDLQARIDRWVNLTSLHEPAVVRKAATPSLRRRPNLSNDYVASESEAEKLLADIWQQLLGLERVGVRDNFFELGGDSILGIQVTARANRAGFKLTAKHLFENQTIAELAAAAESSRGAAGGGAAAMRAHASPSRPAEAGGRTPFDFTLAKLDERRLNKLSSLIEKLEGPREEALTNSP